MPGRGAWETDGTPPPSKRPIISVAETRSKLNESRHIFGNRSQAMLAVIFDCKQPRASTPASRNRHHLGPVWCCGGPDVVRVIGVPLSGGDARPSRNWRVRPRRGFPHSWPAAQNPILSDLALSSWPSLPSRPQTHQESSNEHRLPRRRLPCARTRRSTFLSLVSLAYRARALSSPTLCFLAVNPATASRAAAGTRPRPLESFAFWPREEQHQGYD